MTGTNGFKDSEHTHRVNIGGKLRCIETYLNMALGCQVVYFIRPDLSYNLDDAHGIAQVCKMQMEPWATFQMSDPFPEIHRTAADDSVNLIPFF